MPLIDEEKTAKQALLRVATAVGVSCTAHKNPDVLLGMILGRMQAESPYAALLRTMLTEIDTISSARDETDMDDCQAFDMIDGKVSGWKSSLLELEAANNGHNGDSHH